MNLNIRAKADYTYDAIVVGSGISGGWAAKELCEKGLKTLVLERGREVKHVEDYPNAFKAPWELPHRGEDDLAHREGYPIQSLCYAFDESTQDFFVNDLDHPYNQVKPFRWIRGYQVGGRSLTWGRQCYRWSDLDFEANAKDGFGVDWPIRYQDLAPWYDYVEGFAGISGNADGIPHLPDGKFLPPMEMFCLETHVKEQLKKKYPDRHLIIGRAAHNTLAHQGRGQCQYRNLCYRGCPYGAYFSSNSATLPAAAATGNLTLRPHSVVSEVIWDAQKNKAVGVRIVDAVSKETVEYFAKIIFLNASTLGTTSILLNSTSDRFPNGFANGSDQVGRNLMDHHFTVGATGTYDGFADQYYYGRRPNGIYIARFRNVKDSHPDFVRGYGIQGEAFRPGWERGVAKVGVGEGFKKELTQPGPWSMNIGCWGECLPYEDNRATLNPEKPDQWGLPTLDISCEWKENEYAMRKDMAASTVEMLEAAGLKNVEGYDEGAPPGFCIHEMGTARMGRDPITSVLNEWNQCWEAPNVFISDGACMTSSACQNPSLTYMALTARACDYAVKELKRGNLS